ncbi:hypothetical protein BC939DRAFT_482547 [Gamsiella multidivaricata]|uniref:uncharacterized protein n=1 Tax=Gamsiella multidivaricata TaxID=101098 RepID=UPI00221F7B05|nr:uncharacterized protein BC939DRAFT_482547 [Gamsiella multidivaricata]KAI7815830.1 hypothetical protein BC939DRAFT_482547 [Gamsiella multidivaricata]
MTCPWLYGQRLDPNLSISLTSHSVISGEDAVRPSFVPKFSLPFAFEVCASVVVDEDVDVEDTIPENGVSAWQDELRTQWFLVFIIVLATDHLIGRVVLMDMLAIGSLMVFSFVLN